MPVCSRIDQNGNSRVEMMIKTYKKPFSEKPILYRSQSQGSEIISVSYTTTSRPMPRAWNGRMEPMAAQTAWGWRWISEALDGPSMSDNGMQCQPRYYIHRYA